VVSKSKKQIGLLRLSCIVYNFRQRYGDYNYCINVSSDLSLKLNDRNLFIN
jgi:hypothetical protein